MHGAGDVRVEEVPDPTMQEPTDAVVRVVRSGICSSDLWAYGRCRPASRAGPMSHEFLGVVEVLRRGVSSRARRPGGHARTGTPVRDVLATVGHRRQRHARRRHRHRFSYQPAAAEPTYRFTFVRMSASGIEASPSFEGWLCDQACDPSAEVSGEAGSQGSR